MEIKIGKAARACKACDHTFQHEEVLFSLVRVEDSFFVREDYCERCWDPNTAEVAYSAWSPRFYDSAVAEREPPEVFSPLRRIFYDSVESNERSELAVAYLAAQLLRRQKVFRLIKESEDPDGTLKVALFSDRIGNRLIELRDPSLSHRELEDGRRILMERLNALENPDAESKEDAKASAEDPSPHADQEQRQG